MNHIQYVKEEVLKYYKRLGKLEMLDPSVKRYNKTSFIWRLNNRPEEVAEAVAFLIDGQFGFGPSLIIKEMIDTNINTNKDKVISDLVVHAGAMNWFCPRGRAYAAWRSLGEKEQGLINALVESEVNRYRKEVSDGDTQNFMAMKAGREPVKL